LRLAAASFDERQAWLKCLQQHTARSLEAPSLESQELSLESLELEISEQEKPVPGARRGGVWAGGVDEKVGKVGQHKRLGQERGKVAARQVGDGAGHQQAVLELLRELQADMASMRLANSRAHDEVVEQMARLETKMDALKRDEPKMDAFKRDEPKMDVSERDEPKMDALKRGEPKRVDEMKALGHAGDKIGIHESNFTYKYSRVNCCLQIFEPYYLPTH